MIIKSFEHQKIDLNKYNFFLLYGENEGHKKQIIEQKFKKFYSENIYSYDENEIINNQEIFFNNIFSKSFFENEKLIIVNRVTDKIRDIIEEILEKKTEDLVLILNAGTLEKKSKIRSFFEKNKETVCIPFYEDSGQTLSTIAGKFFRDKKIPISQQSINLIIQRCRCDRQNLDNELGKIESFTVKKGTINNENILKLTNLAENYSVTELVDSCLSKNKKKTLNILNENNYSSYILKEPHAVWKNYNVIMGDPMYVNGHYKLSKIIKNGFSSLRILSKNPFAFKRKNRNIKLQFDFFHGVGIMDKAIDVLDKKEKNDFKEYINNEYSFNRENMFICNSKKLMNEYFSRVNYSNVNFKGYSKGWKTDMGMIYILFGPPDDLEVYDDPLSRVYSQRWHYYRLNKFFDFVDEQGFGDYRLSTPFFRGQSW